MRDEEFKSFKTKVLTLLSILSVLVFIIYIGFLIYLNLTPPLHPKESPNVEVVKVYKKEAPNSWRVRLKFKFEGIIIMATMNIEDGEVIGEK